MGSLEIKIERDEHKDDHGPFFFFATAGLPMVASYGFEQ